MEEASLGEWEQRVVISLELSGKAELGTTLCHQRRSAGGREQAEGLNPGGPGRQGSPVERRAPMGVSLLCPLSLPGSRSSRGPGSPLLLSLGGNPPEAEVATFLLSLPCR